MYIYIFTTNSLNFDLHLIAAEPCCSAHLISPSWTLHAVSLSPKYVKILEKICKIL